MIQNQRPPIRRIAFPILIALSISHCLNDMLQSVISAVYPLFKEDLSLSFAQIGLITLVYQMSASVFQPLMGLFFREAPHCLVIADRYGLYFGRYHESGFCY